MGIVVMFSTMPSTPDLPPTRLRRAGLGNYFRPRDLETLGITAPGLRTLLRRGTVEKVARGLYHLTGAEPTEFDAVAASCARTPRAIVCLLTALQIHGIGTALSPEVWLAIPHGTRPPKTTVARIRVVRFSGPMLTAGIERTTVDGVPTHITGPARTIVDCLRLKSLVDRGTALEALRHGLTTGAATSNQILRIARACDVFERVRRDLEVLTA
jgi:predicted transcriptional regulator of viral defense system